MLSRRQTLGLLPIGFAAPATAGGMALSRPKLGDDGLHHFDWYLESFLDIPEDIAAAKAAGKRLVVMWGLKGCPACRRMHEVHLMDPATQAYIRRHFEVLHLNILGAREVTGLGGRKLPEKALAEAEGVRSTPLLQFMPEHPSGKEAARFDRLPDVLTFRAIFRFVVERGYDAGSFDDWLKRQA
jgi:thioredoxin-related protein